MVDESGNISIFRCINNVIGINTEQIAAADAHLLVPLFPHISHLLANLQPTHTHVREAQITSVKPHKLSNQNMPNNVPIRTASVGMLQIFSFLGIA